MPRTRNRDGSHRDDERGDSFAERFDALRRRYIPLPDEVIHEYLGEDEYVIHSDHPSFRAFLVKNIALVILLPVMGPLFVAFFRGGGLNWTSIVIFLILDAVVAILALRRLGDRYTNYVITNLRLMRVTGIISRKAASIPWTRMTGLGYKQSAWARLMGYASIEIESANEESGLREFSDINDAAAFHKRLLDMISAKSGQSRGREPKGPTRGRRRSFFQKRRERRAMVSQQATGDTGPDAAPGGAPSPGDAASTVGAWAADTWSAATSAVRQGLSWPGSTDRATTDTGTQEGRATGRETTDRQTTDDPTRPGPPPPPSVRPPYRGDEDQRAPGKPGQIVISTTSRLHPRGGQPRRPKRPAASELPEAPSEDDSTDADNEDE